MKTAKFILMGTTAFLTVVSGFVLVSASISQDDLYEDVITKPVESVQEFLGIKNDVKKKYMNFIEEDKVFLSKLEVPKEIVNIDIIYKNHGVIDKAFYPLMKFGQWILSINEENQINIDSKYDGTNSMYGAYFSGGKITNEYIMLGINAFEKRDLNTYNGLYQIFDKSEQKMTSFVFFHELGHKIAHSIGNEDEKIDDLVKIFEKEKGIAIEDESKKFIRSQYAETYADTFAMMMMYKKYPEVNFEKSRDLLAGLRLHSGESTHLSAPGLIKANKPTKDKSLSEIMKDSDRSALITAEFYSSVDFADLGQESKDVEKRAIPVKLIGLDRNQVRSEITNAREKFLTNSKKDSPSKQ